MKKLIERKPIGNGYLCVNVPGGCRAPIACDSFGYCRERNFDGAPNDERNFARRRAESDAVYNEQKRKR